MTVNYYYLFLLPAPSRSILALKLKPVIAAETKKPRGILPRLPLNQKVKFKPLTGQIRTPILYIVETILNALNWLVARRHLSAEGTPRLFPPYIA